MGTLKTGLKVLVRSRSPGFARDYFRTSPDGSIAVYAWRGQPVSYRPGTSDTGLIYNILLKDARGEYTPPPEFDVDPASIRTVLDIGANAGYSAVYFANRFPNATIHAFEPAPPNVAMLERNGAPTGRIRCHPFALGDADGELVLYESDDPANFGGFSLHDEEGVDRGKSVRIPVRRTDAALAALGIDSVDVVKIDTEGAEWEILTAMDPAMLRGVKLIMGELHGRRDFALLDYLQPHFHIGMRKGITKRLFNFYALRRA